MAANSDKWLDEALVQYLNPVIPVPGDPYEHLSTFRTHHPFEIVGGEDVIEAHEEVVSDVLYIPPASEIGDVALDETCCVVICKFRKPDSKKQPNRIMLWVDEIKGASRESALRAVASGDEVSITENDIGSTFVRASASVETQKGKPTVKERVVYDKQGVCDVPSMAASGLLLVCLSPALDPRILRAKVKTHQNVPIR